MKSLTQLYKIGRGPSSSHTIGPQKIAEYALKQFPGCTYKAILYGSLALTGGGHGTENVLKRTLGEDCTIVCNTGEQDLPHPNTMDIIAYRNGVKAGKLRGISVGGGTVEIAGVPVEPLPEVYPHNSYAEIRQFASAENMRLSDYAFAMDKGIYDYLGKVWEVMQKCVEEGLNADGELPGGLHLLRKAKFLLEQHNTSGESDETHQARLLYAYAFAVAEQNADNGLIVTAPTCGAAGVLPGVLYYMKKHQSFDDDAVIRALATAGIIGNIVKTNASISGAECGCQAEIGTACSMTAAAVTELYGLNLNQTECAAEVAMEHNLGLTCDPVMGLVQVPCIERNAMAAMRALDCFRLAYYLTDLRKISFDTIVKTMYETGRDMNSRYRETAEGGIAKNFDKKKLF